MAIAWCEKLDDMNRSITDTRCSVRRSMRSTISNISLVCTCIISSIAVDGDPGRGASDAAVAEFAALDAGLGMAGPTWELGRAEGPIIGPSGADWVGVG